MQRIAIVDHGLCNVDSMWRAVEECGAKGDVTSDPADLAHADKIVLPGVGSFADAMDVLVRTGLAEAIREHVVVNGVPLLGVCLGMQLLANAGTEVRSTAGLGLIDADVVRLVPGGTGAIGATGATCATDRAERIPHVGWNEVDPRFDHAVFAGIPAGADFYFVHSYHVRCNDPSDVLATTPYCGGFTSAVARGRIVGTQFHPEKSQVHGLRLLRNFVAW